MTVEVALNTPLADALSDLVQPKLSEIGWNTGGLDDSALGEYIILMLVNGKTQDQIAAELSNDLLNLEPENTEPRDFSQWLFEQVELLNDQFNSIPTLKTEVLQPQIQPPLSEPGKPSQNAGKQSESGGSPDGGMPDVMEGVQDGSMFVELTACIIYVANMSF